MLFQFICFIVVLLFVFSSSNKYEIQNEFLVELGPTPFPHRQRKAICFVPLSSHLAAVDLLDSPPPAAAPAAGGWGIDRSRCVYSVGCRRVPAGGAKEAMVPPERLLREAVPSSVSGAPAELCGRSAVPGVSASRRRCGRRFPRPVSVVAVLEFEGSDGGDDVDQAGAVVRCAGWRRCGAEDRRLPGHSGAPPSPRLRGGVVAGFAGGACCLTTMLLGSRRALLFFFSLFWVFL